MKPVFFKSITIGFLALLSSLVCALSQSSQPANLSSSVKKIADLVPRANAIIDAYQGEKRQPIIRKLHVIYWTPADRPPSPRHEERVDKFMTDIKRFYLHSMIRLGLGAKTIQLDRNQNGTLRIHTVKGTHPYAHYGKQSGSEIRKECVEPLRKAGIDIDEETILILCNMSNWHPKHRIINQNSPYYAAGNATKGTAWLVDSPILDLDTLTEKGQPLRDGEYGKISLGKYNSIFIGGTAHELGHALSAPHISATEQEIKDLGKPILGQGIWTYGQSLRGEGPEPNLSLAHALRFAAHPMFTASAKGFGEKAEYKVTNTSISNRGKFFIYTSNITSDIPCHAVIGYMDPSGNQDYNATATVAVPDKNGNFTLVCNALKPGATGMLRVVFLFANGDATSNAGQGGPGEFHYPYIVDQSGRVDLSFYQMTTKLKPFLDAVVKGNATIDMVPRTSSTETFQIAKRLIASQQQDRPLPKPADIPSKTRKVILTDTTPDSAKTGWGNALFDRLPGSNPLLAANQTPYATGVYAHAESSITYQLGGKWNSLMGLATIASGQNGAATFIIKGDDKVLWQSERTTQDELRKFKINLAGVQNLELIATDSGTGLGSSWALWLNTELSR